MKRINCWQKRISRHVIGLAMILAGGITSLCANDEPAFADTVMALSLEELMDVRVEIVSKKATSIAETPAAVAVITGEDIRRSGARSLPEILRQAPGIQVARQSTGFWGVSIRGFNDTYSNKLLVMMDGRSLYTPLFSGTFWDAQDTLLEDIDRIEIVRGPGSTVWGANAVNGVINIITKNAKETQGTLVSVGGGSERHLDAGFRHGLKLSDDLFLRLYGKHTRQDDLVRTTGAPANDSYYLSQGGFRMDWLPEDGARLTLQGDLYNGKLNNDYTTFPTGAITPGLGGLGGGNVLTRLEKDLGGEATLRVQAYYDRTVRQVVVFDETRDTGDFEIQANLPLGERHELTVGAGYRISSDHQGQTATITFSEQDRVTHVSSLFVQDSITLVPGRLKLSLGSKLEHNQFTGLEVQPGVRLGFTPATNHSAWLSVTRAVRTPSRVEDDIQVASVSGGAPVRLLGQRTMKSEDLLAFEAGYRVTPHPRITLDSAVFYNEYDDLRSLRMVAPSPAFPTFVADFLAGNDMTGETYGFELSPSFQLQDWWRLRVNYSFLQMQLHLPAGHTDTTSPLEEHQNPHHTVTFVSHMDLPADFEIDIFARYVDHLFVPRANSGAGAGVPAFWGADLRLGWRPTKNLEVSVIGQNLFDSEYQEFRETFVSGSASQVQRSFFGMLTYRF